MIVRFNKTIGEALAKVTSYKYKEREAKLLIETIIETYYEKNELFQKALLKRFFKIEDVLIKQQEKALENIQEVQKIQKEYHNKKIKHNKLKI
ncbi:22788_t:CDS:2, partial [Dentiscutata erythropus]